METSYKLSGFLQTGKQCSVYAQRGSSIMGQLHICCPVTIRQHYLSYEMRAKMENRSAEIGIICNFSTCIMKWKLQVVQLCIQSLSKSFSRSRMLGQLAHLSRSILRYQNLSARAIPQHFPRKNGPPALVQSRVFHVFHFSTHVCPSLKGAGQPVLSNYD